MTVAFYVGDSQTLYFYSPTYAVRGASLDYFY